MTDFRQNSNVSWSLRFNEDGRYIASGEHPWIRIFNVRVGKCVASYQGHDDVVWCLVFAPDGKGLVTGSWDKRVIHWNMSRFESTECDNSQKGDISRHNLMEISRFVGHKVRRLSGLSLTLQ